MKKVFCLTLLLVGMVLSSCKYNEPEIVTKSSRLFMVVGDYASVKVEGSKEVTYSYSSSRDEAKPVFEYTNQGEALVHALNPGTDTLFVGYKWTAGISAYAYGNQKAVIITVFDK